MLKHQEIPDVAKFEILDQILGAVSHINQCGLIHGNLKPENILIDLTNEGRFNTVKLCDLRDNLVLSDNESPSTAPEII